MKVKLSYPLPEKRTQHWNRLVSALNWAFLFTAYICPIVNLTTGGKAWSVVVLWSLWILRSNVVAPALVEYNRISQFIKFIVHACVLLILIDVFLSPGWAVEVVPIVCFSGLIIAGFLFFTNLQRQKQNMFPMLGLIAVSLGCTIVGLIVWREERLWSLVVMGALAFALLAGCVCVLGLDFLRELKKRFHVK
ncbi:MAG: DUF6320 domain-containing protein [Clostridia bacterium]|nr:DUF6320 domain-containing protein [Clostridia bacterium]